MTDARHHVALATCRALPEITADDRLLAEALNRDGVQVGGVPWDATVDWTQYDAVVLRSTWDFHRRLPAFTRWLRQLEADGVTLVNPSRVVGWNVTKRYLQQLEAKGIRVVPTRWITPSEEGLETSLAAVAAEHGWHAGMVVKPVVSASAHDTWIARGTDRRAEGDRFRNSLARSSHGLMLQPYLPEIASRGEWSLVFIGGAYSHAVLKRPAAGDFRVQRDHGGTADPAEPPSALIQDADGVLRAAATATEHAPNEILYARVDGVEVDGQLMLMEFEAVEPVLFLGASASAAERLATALRGALATWPAGVSRGPST